MTLEEKLASILAATIMISGCSTRRHTCDPRGHLWYRNGSICPHCDGIVSNPSIALMTTEEYFTTKGEEDEIR